jgi:hypothetical protein
MVFFAEISDRLVGDGGGGLGGEMRWGLQQSFLMDSQVDERLDNLKVIRPSF